MTNIFITGRRLVAIILALVLVLLSSNANAAANINISVTVNTVVCKINNDQPVKAEFGDVQIDKLSAAHTSFSVAITCDSEPSGTVQMSIRGTGSDFDANALKTDVPGLGVSIINPLNSENLELNKFYDVQQEFGLSSKVGTFTLNAGLMSDGKTTLAGGEFNASATLVLQMS